MRRPRFCLFDVPHLQDAFTENNDSGRGHGTTSGTRREPIPGGLGIASLLCTVPVAAPQPLPLRHRRVRKCLADGTEPGSLCGVRDSLKQGCLSEAYRDVFTACPTHHASASAFSIRSDLTRVFLLSAVVLAEITAQPPGRAVNPSLGAWA